MDKVLFTITDSLNYDFRRIAPLDFAFVDGAHDVNHVLSDTLKVYEILRPGGFIVWHDFNSPAPWVEVRKALDCVDFAEAINHVAGTEVAFLQKLGAADHVDQNNQPNSALNRRAKVPQNHGAALGRCEESTVHTASAGVYPTHSPTRNPRPAISVIVPVYNGASFLERSINSVRCQTFADWELLAVDDGSTDDSHTRLCQYAATDPRIRVIRLPLNRGPATARNAGLFEARGETITYLDCDDEYFPDYLSHVHAWHAQAEVLVFAYEIVQELPGRAGQFRIQTWDPAPLRRRLLEGIVIPLGVAHSRRLLERTGSFQEGEGFFFEEDMDLWQRMARAGAEFLFLPLKNGRYHVRPDSVARKRQSLKVRQGEATSLAEVDISAVRRRIQ